MPYRRCYLKNNNVFREIIIIYFMLVGQELFTKSKKFYKLFIYRRH